MTPTAVDWNELKLSEDPAVELLRSLGYTYVAPEVLEKERDNFKDPVLASRLASAVRRLNPWLSDENTEKAVRTITHVAAASLAEANEQLHTALTFGIALEQDLGQGKKSHTVRFVDYDVPSNNELLVTRQYRVEGSKKTIIPDVVLLVNGLPFVVIECKSPTIGEKWVDDAVGQLLRYQEATPEFRDVGAPRLFNTVQLLVATCGQSAVYATVNTAKRHWAEWKATWPLSADHLETKLGRKPSVQDVTLAGLCRPENLLDIVRSFVVFEPEGGRTVRKVCRYKQFVAVNKAIARIRGARKPDARGGVIWHTQGSGKSLTMLWLALKLRRDPRLNNPTIVIVTDRTDLDVQISGTFVRCGYPNPTQAEGVKHLRELLQGPPGQTVSTTVQKFMDLTKPTAGTKRKRARADAFPVLNDSPNVFVLADECHRTQYGGLAANMRQALPNACFLGFSGTPIDKKDRSTPKVFGPYIDTYTIEQSIADGATVPIYYESRLPELRIVGQSLDRLFDRMFADRTDEEREAIKKKFGSERAIAEAPRRIEAIALDLQDHFEQFIRPNGFKAQVVAVSRDAVATYAENFERLNAPRFEVVISGNHNDPERLARYHKTKEQRDRVIERFKDPADPLSILVVCDMLLTGFDAPVEQVMYLDSPLREHSLLQAIARVNRTAENKTFGLVVDYWGISEALQDALEIFAPDDIAGVMAPKTNELPRLQARHQAAMKLFQQVKDRNDLNVCIDVLAPDDVRAEFNRLFRQFSKSLDMLFPDPRALHFVDDMRWLGKIREAAKARYHDARLSLDDCGAKVRKLIEDAVVADGIQVLVKQVSIFSVDFEEKLARVGSTEAQASEMEHAVSHEIDVKLEENPAFYLSLRQQLEQLVADRRAQRIDAARELERLQALAKAILEERKAAEKLGLSDLGFAVYGVLQPLSILRVAEQKPGYSTQHKEMAALIDEAIAPLTELVDWGSKDDVLREMRKKVKRVLRAGGIADDDLEPMVNRVIELARVRRGR